MLDRVHVLDLTRLLPGAYATLLLADLGCDVVKVEDPRGGDPMRHLALTTAANTYFARVNRGKRSITLDLRSPLAAAVLDALLRQADVLVESFRPSTARRLGVDAATLRARHARLIHASISGFGQSGPYVERASHDINYQALAGSVRPPRVPDQLVGDIGSAMTAALQIAAALFARERTGEGRALDISIHEASLPWALFPRADEFPQARYNVYETADGRWLALGALEDKFWLAFCERVGAPPTASVDDIRALLRTRTRDQWLAHFASDDVCLTAVYALSDVECDPHVVDRGAAAVIDGVLHATPHAATESRSAPSLGAHTDEVLAAAGIGRDRREQLRKHGVI